ncbi:hypothetical protein R3P38DRAFT_3519140 [Favolaschia claudopus]|uniref:Uncharacterized protein n=1 Tax=Favolaschia claudopus TaxID=2862362 RepID=A0AAW0BRB2_9AGAR
MIGFDARATRLDALPPVRASRSCADVDSKPQDGHPRWDSWMRRQLPPFSIHPEPNSIDDDYDGIALKLKLSTDQPAYHRTMTRSSTRVRRDRHQRASSARAPSYRLLVAAGRGVEGKRSRSQSKRMNPPPPPRSAVPRGHMYYASALEAKAEHLTSPQHPTRASKRGAQRPHASVLPYAVGGWVARVYVGEVEAKAKVRPGGRKAAEEEDREVG